MKIHRQPEGSATTAGIFEFSYPRPENFLRVESRESGVRICAARDNFSERDKEFFIRHLVDEGFIADRYRWFSGGVGEALGLEWQIEDYLDEAVARRSLPRRRANKFMVRLIGSAALLWLVQIGILMIRSQ